MLFNDSALPNCATALQANTMAEQFAGYFAAVYPDLEWQVVRCAIEKVYYRYAHHCGVLYRLTLRHPDGTEADEWFFGRVCLPNSSYNQLERAAAGVQHYYVAHDFLRHIPPVSFWPDLDMILWVFPQDPKIRTLSYLLDPDFVRRQIRTHVSDLLTHENGFTNGPNVGPGADVNCRRIKYMPGKRCVLRFHFDLNGHSDESRQVSFYSKTYSDGWSRYHFDMLKSVYDQLNALTPRVNIPKPLVYLDGYNTFFQEDWGGRALMDELADQNWEELFPQIAEMVATLHCSSINGFRPGPDTDEVLDTSIEDGKKLTYLLPQFEPFILPALERLRLEKSTIDGQSLPAVPLHGACRIEQMLLRDSELGLVDFDAVAIGDPLYDVAEFIASLRYLEISRGLFRESLNKATELFCQRYASRVPWMCDYRRIEWYAQAFLITKMYAATKNLDVQALQKLEHVGQQIMDDRLD